MKGGLEILMVIFGLVAVAQAKYDLSCSKQELSIRWPSYESNSEYYMCPRLFGRPMTVTCNPGEVFTFVLQSCTNPNRYIPAPALKSLQTASSSAEVPDLKPKEILTQPAILSSPVFNVTSSQPQERLPTIQLKPVVEEIKPIHTEENIVATAEETVNPAPPLPPTPAPTPPVVEKITTKKPSAASGKKSVTKKKKSTVSASTEKKPSTSSGKKTPPKRNVKPNSKAGKSAKKSGKKPTTTDQKSSKA